VVIDMQGGGGEAWATFFHFNARLLLGGRWRSVEELLGGGELVPLHLLQLLLLLPLLVVGGLLPAEVELLNLLQRLALEVFEEVAEALVVHEDAVLEYLDLLGRPVLEGVFRAQRVH